jgi:hypothetical protein
MKCDEPLMKRMLRATGSSSRSSFSRIHFHAMPDSAECCCEPEAAAGPVTTPAAIGVGSNVSELLYILICLL